MERRSGFWRLSAVYAAYFLAIGILLPFWPLWLDARGLDAAQIGLVLAAAFWIKVAAEPVMARVVDRTGRTRLPTALLGILAAAGYVALTGVNGFWPILVVSAAIAACMHPILPVMESVTLSHAARSGYDYGRMRLWGSVSFICATMGMGWILGIWQADSVVWMMAVASGLVALGCWCAPERVRSSGIARPGRREWIQIARRLAVLVLVAGLIQASHTVLYGFASLHWRSIGISEFTIGLFWTAGVLAEIVLFAVMGRLRLGAHHLLALAALAGVIRWPLLAVADTVPVIFAAQLLHAATFAAAHLGAMIFLTRVVPPARAATGQALYYALVGGVIGGCMMPVAGMLFDRIGADAFWVMAVLCVAALPASALLRHRD